MKLSFITTVYNEEKSISVFLESLLSQTKKVSEIIIVDGGSKDKTVAILKLQEAIFKKKRIRFKIITKKGNRSVGRNEAIKNATGDIILCSDSGNILDPKWVEEISKPFSDTSVDVVAGYYKGKAKTFFQKCLIPYALVMPDRVNPDTFLPATRSIAFTKKIWKKAGMFNEEYSHNEDYVFARKLREIGATIIFARKAIVSWIPRSTAKDAFVMFFRFALGDIEAKIIRPKVVILFIRYFFFISLFILSVRYASAISALVFTFFILLYLLYSVLKNYRYVKNTYAFIYLPVIQIVSDLAVMTGSSMGAIKLGLLAIKRHKVLSLIILFYILAVLWQLPFGTPNIHHPYLYNMDEWHQLMAIRAIIQHGTTTISGSAEIPFLYPVVSGIYLIPFALLGFINPFSLKSSAIDLEMQQRLFEILRSVNLYFGIGSILLIAAIAKKYVNGNSLVAAFFFGVSPILISLSGYFKYDIALIFFIILTFYFIFQFGQSPRLKNYLLAAIAAALAMAVKFSALPLLPLLFVAFFLYRKKGEKSFSFFFPAAITYAITFILAGIPNLLIGKASYAALLYSNLVASPNTVHLLNLPAVWWLYLPFVVFPFAFGHIAYCIGVLSFLFLTFYYGKTLSFKSLLHKHVLFLLSSFVLFFISLLPLKMGGGSNRVLVLLPFIALFISITFTFIEKYTRKNHRYLLICVMAIISIAQILESLLWVQLKTSRDPQYEASKWIEKNIPKGSIIGIENIPIYQGVPNIVEKEFYAQDTPGVVNRYRYEVIDSKSKKLPSIVSISAGPASQKIYLKADKNDLLKRLEKENYKKVITFTPDLTYYYLLGDDLSYTFTALSSAVLTVSIYIK